MSKKRILNKLGQQCVICNSTKNLRLHHKKPIKSLKRRYALKDLPNLVVLCDACHKAIHYYKSVKKENENLKWILEETRKMQFRHVFFGKDITNIG